MPRTKLTASQLSAKKRVESEGGKFIPPSEYRHKKQAKTLSNGATKRMYDTQPAAVRAINPCTMELVEQILDPESSQDLQRWPKSLGLSGVYKCKNVINAKFAEDGRSSVVVHPRLSNSILTTAGNEVVGEIPLNVYPVFLPNTLEYVQMKAGIDYEIGSPIFFPGEQVLMPTTNPGTSSNLMYPGQFIPKQETGGALIIKGLVTGAPDGSLELSINLFDNDGTQVFTQGGVNTADGVITIGMASSGYIPYKYFGFSIKSTYDYTGIINIVLSSQLENELSWNYTLNNHSQHMEVQDIRDASTFYESASKYTVISQSLLCTPEMSFTNNGGSCCIARQPAGTRVGDSSSVTSFQNWYEAISSLPNDSYDGPISKGLYGFYLGADPGAYFYRPVRDGHDFEAPYLACEFTVNDPTNIVGAAVRIKICTIVQFLSDSSIYSMAPSEFIEDWDRAHHMLSMIPACYDNFSHRKTLNKWAKKASFQLINMLKNPNTYKTAAKAGMALASLV